MLARPEHSSTHSVLSESEKHRGDPEGTEEAKQPGTVHNYLKTLYNSVICFLDSYTYEDHPLSRRLCDLMRQLDQTSALRDMRHEGLNWWILQCIRAREVENFKLIPAYQKYNNDNSELIEERAVLCRLQDIVLIVLLTTMPVPRPGIFRVMQWDDIRYDETHKRSFLDTTAIVHKTSDTYKAQKLPFSDMGTYWVKVLRQHRSEILKRTRPVSNQPNLLQPDLNKMPVFLMKRIIKGTGNITAVIYPMSTNQYATFVKAILEPHVKYEDTRRTKRQWKNLTHHKRRTDYTSWSRTTDTDSQPKRREFLNVLDQNSLKTFQVTSIQWRMNQSNANSQQHSAGTAAFTYTDKQHRYEDALRMQMWLAPFCEKFHNEAVFDSDIFKMNALENKFWPMTNIHHIQHLHYLSAARPDQNLLATRKSQQNYSILTTPIKQVLMQTVIQFEAGDNRLRLYCSCVGTSNECHVVHTNDDEKKEFHVDYTVRFDKKKKLNFTCKDRIDLFTAQATDIISANRKIFRTHYRTRIPESMDTKFSLVYISWKRKIQKESVVHSCFMNPRTIAKKKWGLDSEDGTEIQKKKFMNLVVFPEWLSDDDS
jgi:hypothetical protein